MEYLDLEPDNQTHYRDIVNLRQKLPKKKCIQKEGPIGTTYETYLQPIETPYLGDPEREGEKYEQMSLLIYEQEQPAMFYYLSYVVRDDTVWKCATDSQ